MGRESGVCVSFAVRISTPPPIVPSTVRPGGMMEFRTAVSVRNNANNNR